jgi:hypothetical protein
MAEAALADDTAPDVIDAPIDAPEAAPEPTVAELATDMGWSPLEQWRGSPDKWKPAHEFLRTTADINRTLAKDVKAMRAETERMARTSASIVEQQVAERVAAAEARFNDAVDAGDANAARAATREVDRLQASIASENPEVGFTAQNAWYGKDDEATAYAVGISQRMAQQGKSVADQLEAAASGVRKRFPELFNDAPPPKPAPGVNAPMTRATSSSNRAKGVNDLPPSARKAGEMFVAKGLVKDLASYAKTWHDENV